MSQKGMTGIDIDLSAGMKISLDIQLKDSPDGKKNRLALSSVVEELLDDDYILIVMPIHQGYYYPLPQDEPILMKFMSGSDLYALTTQFEKRVARDNLLFARMLRLSDVAPHQQRDCYRLPCSMQVTARRERSAGERHAPGGDIEGRTVNFSDGGMLFVSNEEIENDSTLTLNFHIGDVETVGAIVLRTERIPGEDSRFSVAVRFTTMDEQQKQRFYRYIVDMQLEERRRRRSANVPLYPPGKGSGKRR